MENTTWFKRATDDYLVTAVIGNRSYYMNVNVDPIDKFWMVEATGGFFHAVNARVKCNNKADAEKTVVRLVEMIKTQGEAKR